MALVTERKDREMESIVQEKNSEMKLAMEELDLHRKSLLSQLEKQKSDIDTERLSHAQVSSSLETHMSYHSTAISMA